MLQEKLWLEYKWDNNYTVLIEKTVENKEEMTEFWLRKKDIGIIESMFGIPGHLSKEEIEDFIERNIYEQIVIYENQYC